MFIEKHDGLLDAWITEASKPESLLKRFAKGLRKDFQAVNNAVRPKTPLVLDYGVLILTKKLKINKRLFYGRVSST